MCERVMGTPIRTFRAHIKRLMFCNFFALGPGSSRRQAEAAVLRHSRRPNRQSVRPAVTVS
ncbi:hypothetical protein H4W80_001076 [Nonomuraea angiospora]|uniref:HTH luxR-type domain-containing protein n=1 Tax=Nonomuraea angiospora TaxID=46172 RepID=A0ABR9LQ79_9ACTN|nr:hypothetical protein [Nonomuraea angiospora]